MILVLKSTYADDKNTLESKIPDTSGLVKKTRYNTKITELENSFDSSYFIGKSHFEEDGAQNYLIFQPMYKYLKLISNTLNILLWQSEGLSNENVAPPNTNFSPLIDYVGNKIKVKFIGSCLKRSNKISHTHKNSKYLHCL